MRPFSDPISDERVRDLTAQIQAMFEALPNKREVLGADYLMEPADAVVIHVSEMGKKPAPRLRIGATVATARPPFEWLYEVTSDITEADYFKHYLVMKDQIVLAHLKVLTPIDEAEAEIVLNDLKLAREILAEA